jgi:RNA polymerase sigma-70 factor (ECF subfamily)
VTKSDSRMTKRDENRDWEATFWEQAPRIYNFFRYRTRDSAVAQDLTSKTFERAWRYRESYRKDIGAFETWLFQIARNVVITYFQRPHNADLSIHDMEIIAEDVSIERDYQRKEDAARLYALLSQLSKDDQELIALKYGAELTNRNIAQVLDISESNVGTRLYRLIKKLRMEWEATYERG